MSESDGKNPRSPQERAAEHLKKMLRNAAVGGAALGLSGGCGSCGPMVCDPLPTPICDQSPTTSTLLGRMSSTATWRQPDGGEFLVEVSLQAYDEGEAITFAADPGLSGGQLRSVQRQGSTLSFTFAPTAGVTRVDAVIQLDCATIPEALKLGFDVSSPTSGGPVTISSLE